jgi:Fe2+ or Zn2+ uptake regulation protein
MDDLATAGKRRLRAAGKRITPQRKLVLNILAQAKGHLSADDIYERGRRHDARLSLSTVYRTLSVLKDTGLVRELHLDAEHHHYELDAKDQHAHMVCLACGRVIEVDCSAFIEAVGAAHDFKVTSALVELSGHCADCHQQER